MAAERISASRAMGHVGAGARVAATPGCATPETLLRHLGERAAKVPGLTLSAGYLLGTHPFAGAVRRGQLRYRTWHANGPTRALVEEGLADYLPLRANDVPGFLAAGVDVVLFRTTPPDRHGYCSFGPSGSYTRSAIQSAGLVIGEVDETLPRTRGDTQVHRSEIDYLVDADTPTCMYISHEPTPAAARIAALVAELLPRNPTVQLGIGAVPEAVTVALGEGGLGTVRLVGMGSDHLVRLFDTGALRRSDTFPNSAVTAVELLGTRTILDAAHENPAIGVVSSSTCHDPRWLATLPRLVSVNSALQVDLTGQVSGEGIGGRVLAGVGGSFDFFEGARASDGGLRIVALESTTDGGETSKIVPALGEGSAVSIPRHSVDVVVTEHGVARLAGRSLAERIDGLIGVASPSHRHALADSR